VKSVNLNGPLREKLTDARVRALKPAKQGSRYDVLDALVPGLAVRVTDTGNKTFMFRTRYPGEQHSSRRALGKVGALNVEQARTKARDWHQLLDKQIDPLWQAEQERLAKLRAESHTFLAVSEAYFAHIKSEGLVKAKIIERVVRKEFVSRWAARAIHDINQHDVAEVINQAKPHAV